MCIESRCFDVFFYYDCLYKSTFCGVLQPGKKKLIDENCFVYKFAACSIHKCS